MVVAPSSRAARSTSAVNSTSARVASIGLNSTSSTSERAWATAARAWPSTSSRVDCSWWVMWMSLVEMNVWTRGRSLSRTASAARSMSAACARARPAITGPCTPRAIARAAWKSPGEAIGKPASITSTPSRASWCAISSFSFLFSEMPGDCSPSRSVVSKIRTWSVPSFMRSLSVPYLRSPRDRFAAQRPPRAIPPEGGEGEVGGGRGRSACAGWSLHRQDNLPHVLPVGKQAVCVRGLLERKRLVHDRPQPALLDPAAQGREVLVERALRVPQPQHVEADDCARAAHHQKRVEDGRGAEHARYRADAAPLPAHDARGAVADKPPAGPEQRPAL